MNQNIVTLDVRADFRSGQQPCDKIKDALSRVSSGETLRLLVPFEPVPLFEIARNKGLGHEAKQTASGDWEVLFSQNASPEVQPENRSAPEASSCGCGCSASSPV